MFRLPLRTNAAVAMLCAVVGASACGVRTGLTIGYDASPSSGSGSRDAGFADARLGDAAPLDGGSADIGLHDAGRMDDSGPLEAARATLGAPTAARATAVSVTRVVATPVRATRGHPTRVRPTRAHSTPGRLFAPRASSESPRVRMGSTVTATDGRTAAIQTADHSAVERSAATVWTTISTGPSTCSPAAASRMRSAPAWARLSRCAGCVRSVARVPPDVACCRAGVRRCSAARSIAT